MPKVVIVGAGISGLAVAYRLQQRLPGAAITILEQGTRPGGTVQTIERGGFRFEAGPNAFLDTKPTTLELSRELGLANLLIAASESSAKIRYLLLGDKLHLLPNSLGSFLGSRLLSWRGKVSLLMERFRPRGPQLQDESIAAFARRRTGQEAADVLADAMVTGIFAGDPALLSVKACFPRLVQLEQEHGSILRGMARTARQRRAEAKARGEVYQRPGKLWSFREGLSVLIDALGQRLTQPPLYNVAVERIERRPDAAGHPTWHVFAADGRAWQADAVVLACPAYCQADLVRGLDTQLSEQIAAIAYNRVAVVALGYRRADIPMSVDGFGFIAPQKDRRDLLGVQWCSSIYPDRAPADAVLLRALCGGWHRPDVAALDDDALLHAMREELRRAMQITAVPIFAHIVRWDRAIPQYHLGHTDRVAAIEQRVTQHPGLFVGGNAYHGVALNDCTEQGQVLAAQLQQYLAGPPA